MTNPAPAPVPAVTHHSIPVLGIRAGDLIVQGAQVSLVERVTPSPKGLRRGVRITTTRDGFTGSMNYGFGVRFDVARDAR